MCEAFKKVASTAINTVQQIYLGDDFIIDLSPVLGDAVKFDPTLTISLNLINNATLQLAAFEPVIDGTNDNDFVNGKVCAILNSTDLDVIPRGRYYLMLRVTDGTLQKTYRLPIAIQLINLI
jgi:hypothetical protein